MNYAMRYLLHGLVWAATYLIVTAFVLVGAAFFLYAIGVSGTLQSLIAWLWAILVGMYWAHKLACDLVPMGPDGEHFSPPRV